MTSKQPTTDFNFIQANSHKKVTFSPTPYCSSVVTQQETAGLLLLTQVHYLS
jgi:hypothetical protein